MSHQAAAPSTSEADLLERIRQAELESNSSIEQAVKEAERIVKEAKDQAAAMKQKAEEDAKKERERIIADGKLTIQSELQRIHNETSNDILVVRDGSSHSIDLRALVLKILEE